MSHTPGPWRWWTSNSVRRLSSDATRMDGDVLHATVAGGVADIVVSPDDARLLESAPAMDIVLQLLMHGLARIEPIGHGHRAHEFVFDGLCFGLNDSWSELIDLVGWDNARAALARCKGASS